MTEITERLSTALADRYRIERHLGEGGMATVYLAHDLKHDRPVAVKVLRPELAAVLGAERFIQEIKTTANLQHPHILPLFDSGEDDGFLYYVMPSIEGETLRDKLNRETQLGIEEAVRITTDIADALDYAHRHNVIHRDIKPENILLHDGRPMVADFGIALAVSAAAGGRMTETGLSLGTPHYMSPEQATAEKDLTNRSDIYSLGCVLYEMLTGDPPHTGSSAQAIIMKIVTEDVQPVTKLRKSVPPHVAAATAKSLEKLAADRFETAKEFTEALTNPVFALPTHGPTVGVTASFAHRRMQFIWPTLAVVFAVMAVWGWMRSTSPGPPVRLDMTVAPGFQVGIGTADQIAQIAVSPDGSHVVFTGRGDGSPQQQLYRRPLNALEAQPIAGTDGATTAFFSPDGESVGFLRNGQLLRVALAGGQALTIADSPGGHGASWGDDGFVVFTPTASSGLVRVPAVGGTAQVVTEPDRSSGETSHRWPHVLPGGNRVLYTSYRGSIEASRIAAVDLRTGEVKSLIDEAVSARYVTTGHLLYVNASGSLFAVPFDARRLAVTGEPATLLEGVAVDATASRADYAVSETGTLVYATGTSKLRLVLVDGQGVEQVLSDWLDFPTGPRFSPDASRVALAVVREAKRDIWILEPETGTQSRLTLEGNSNWYPEWSPDGTGVVFSSNRTSSQNRDLFWKPVDGGGPAETLVGGEHEQWEASWPREGRFMVYRERHPETGRDLWVLPLDGNRTPTPYLKRSFDDRAPSVSPDGRWVAYTSDESGRDEVYVGSLPQPDVVRQVSNNGGVEPRWSWDGTELFYREGAGFVNVSITTRPTLAVGSRRRLLQGNQYPSSPNHAGYDVHPDGRLLVLVGGGINEIRLIVVLNFFEELKAKVGN